MNSLLKSTRLSCVLTFERAVRVDTYPAFVVRSLLGYHLRRMHCVARQTQCSECVFHRTCAYAFLFESIIEKNTPVLEGRDRASHPFRLICQEEPGTVVSTLRLQVHLFGPATEYIPHVVFALREAGKGGLFRQRVPYQLNVMNRHGQPILEEDRILHSHIVKETHQYPTGDNVENRRFTIRCKSPLRFKVRNHFTNDFSAQDFIFACMRHRDTLFYLYGDGTEIADNNQIPKWEGDVNIDERHLVWRDYQRFSRRQGASMRLGGHIGTLTLSGTAPQWVWETLRLASHIGTGKNTSFGFGDIEVHEE